VYHYCSCFAGLELGGLLGGTLSGVISDKSIRAAKADPNAGLVGRRVQIVMAYTVACIGVLLVLKQVPTGAASLQWLVIAALGFTIYGPQVGFKGWRQGNWRYTAMQDNRCCSKCRCMHYC
jgi:sugar phosphate permease